MSKLLGSVLVDTGRVALFRQKDRALWSKREEGEVFAILVWGRDAHVAIPLLQEKLSFQVTQNENGYLLKTDATEALEKELEGIQRDNVFMWQTLRNNSQDRLWIHNDPIFPIDAEGTGKAYIVRSGEGDGEYPEIPLTKGGAMAPAEVDTVEADFRDLGGKPSDYDLIAAGDLGNVGHQIAKDLLQKHGIEMGENLGLRYDDL